MTELDVRLKSLFAEPPRAPDESFVKRVDRAVMAEEKMVAAQAAMWRHFTIELVGTAAILAAFYLLWKFAPNGIAVDALMNAPGMAASMVILLWLAVQLKSTPMAR